MNQICIKCKAKFWKDEVKSKNGFSMCCKNGKIALPNLKEPPNYIQDLLDKDIDFKNNIRAYNSILAFASLGANVDQRLIEKKGNYCFRIHGSVYHFMGSLLPKEKNEAKFAQIYIYDTDFQTDTRMQLMPSLNKQTLIGLQNMIQNCNPYVELFRTAASSIEANSNSNNNFQMIISDDLQNKDTRRYNKPTSSDVAVVIPGDASEECGSRDIMITKKDGNIQRISELNGSYDPLMYVLLFPYGDEGYKLNIKHNSGKKHVSMME